jgi:hypothetical protein
LADDVSERDQAIDDQFCVLDEVGGVTDHIRNQDPPGAGVSCRARF